METVIITKEYWLNSQLSIARFYGGIKIDGQSFIIVGNDKDLIREDWVKVYKKYGREKTIEFVKYGKTLKDIRKDEKELRNNRLKNR
jgi:hypothetical protein